MPEIPWPVTFDPRGDEVLLPPRRFTCHFYDRCLGLAVQQRWPSWCCSQCWVNEESDPEQRTSDAIGLLNLFFQLFPEEVL